jgi:hypothetical protein
VGLKTNTRRPVGLERHEPASIGLWVIDLYEIPITLQATSSRKNMRQVAPHRGNTGTDDGAAIDLKRRESLLPT